MKTIEIKKGEGWVRYNTSKPLLSGEYVFARPQGEEKNLWPFIAAQNKNGKFYWLLKLEDWVLRKKFGLINVYKLEKGDLEKFDLIRLMELAKNKIFRPWQTKILEEIQESLTIKKEAYRKVILAPLGAGKTFLAIQLSQVAETLLIAPKSIHGVVKKLAQETRVECPDLVTYESAYKKLDKKDYQIVILDEILAIKNPQAQRSQRIQERTSKKCLILGFTGTPIAAKGMPDLRFIRVLGSGVPLEEKYWMHQFGINPHHEDIPGKKANDEEGFSPRPLAVDGWRTEEIVDFCKPFLVVLGKEDVETPRVDLVFKKEFLRQPALFNSILKGLTTAKGQMKALVQARTLTSGFFYRDDLTTCIINEKEDSPKIEKLKEIIEANPGESFVIISNWQAEQELLKAQLVQYNPAMITTRTNRIEEYNRFVEGKTDVIIISASQTEGMNLQRARFLIFLSNSFSPVKRAQAIGRIFRPGQERDCVVIDILCENTLDEIQLDALEGHIHESENYLERASNQLDEKSVQLEVEQAFHRMCEVEIAKKASRFGF